MSPILNLKEKCFPVEVNLSSFPPSPPLQSFQFLRMLWLLLKTVKTTPAQRYLTQPSEKKEKETKAPKCSFQALECFYLMFLSASEAGKWRLPSTLTVLSGLSETPVAWCFNSSLTDCQLEPLTCSLAELLRSVSEMALKLLLCQIGA